MKRALEIGVFVLCVAASVAGIYNVLGDNAEVERLAEQTACEGEGPACRAQKTFMERTPISQTFDYSTPKRKVSVRCSRAFVLGGAYTCALR